MLEHHVMCESLDDDLREVKSQTHPTSTSTKGAAKKTSQMSFQKLADMMRSAGFN